MRMKVSIMLAWVAVNSADDTTQSTKTMCLIRIVHEAPQQLLSDRCDV